MAKQIKSIDDLRLGPHNANLGTDRGRKVLVESLKELGAGRSIVVDRNGVVVGGNKTLEAAISLGLDIATVKSDGSRLVVVQRTDLSLDEDEDTRARTLALADNRVAELSLNWDPEELAVQVEDLAIPLWSSSELQLITDASALSQFADIAAGEDKPKEDKKPPEPQTPPPNDLLPFHVLLSQQQRERLISAINSAKSKHGLETTAEALDVIAQEYLNE